MGAHKRDEDGTPVKYREWHFEYWTGYARAQHGKGIDYPMAPGLPFDHERRQAWEAGVRRAYRDRKNAAAKKAAHKRLHGSQRQTGDRSRRRGRGSR